MTSCTKEVSGYNNTISDYTKKQMLEKEIIIPNIETNNQPDESAENNVIEKEKQAEIPEVKELIEDPPLDKIDINDKNYQIHHGKIECLNTTECMEKTLPIQLKYNNLISDVTYLDILTNNHQVVGYFIKYTFKQTKFESYEKCITTIDEIKETLNDKISTITCSENGELTIKADYEVGELNEEN